MIAKFLVLVFISFKLSANAVSKGLPSYIEKCSLSNPSVQECYLKNGNAAIPHLLNGDKKFNIPSFNPLLLDTIIFSPSSSLTITFKNLEVSGLAGTKLTKMKYNGGSNIFFNLEIPVLSIKGKYETKGRILLLPFEGTGPCDIKIINGVYNVTTLFDNMNFEFKKPLRLVNSTVLVSVEKSIYKFDNLFNGNKQLGDEMNRFLNDNHKELEPDFQPVFAQTINTVIKAALSGILGKTYYSDMFLP